MLYTKAQVSFCDTTIFKRSPLAARGVWLQLCILCAKEENGGEIAKAGGFDDTDWLMSCGLKQKDIETARLVGLVSWKNDTLVVHGYDTTGEERCRFNRSVGTKGGRPVKRSDNPEPNPSVNRPDNPEPNPNETQSSPVQSIPVQSKTMKTGSARAAPAPDFINYSGNPPKISQDPPGISRLQALHPKVFVGKGERDSWQAVLDEFGWEPVAAGCTALAQGMRPDKRVLLSTLTGWLANHYARQAEA